MTHSVHSPSILPFLLSSFCIYFFLCSTSFIFSSIHTSSSSSFNVSFNLSPFGGYFITSSACPFVDLVIPSRELLLPKLSTSGYNYSSSSLCSDFPSVLILIKFMHITFSPFCLHLINQSKVSFVLLIAMVQLLMDVQAIFCYLLHSDSSHTILFSNMFNSI